MHYDQGQIRAYQDHEVDQEMRLQIESHLADCPACQAKAQQLAGLAGFVQARFQELDFGEQTSQPNIPLVRSRLHAQLKSREKEQKTMWHKVFNRRLRPAWIALAVLALLAVSMAFAPARAVANSFLGLFRVQRISVVQVDPGNLPQQLGASTQFENMLTQNVQHETYGEHQEVASVAEAESYAGFRVRLPEAAGEAASLAVEPGGKATFVVDREQVRALLDEIGRSDIQLPKAIHGAKVEVEVPRAVVATFGACGFEPGQEKPESYDPDSPEWQYSEDCVTLVQMPSPTISAPPGLDLAQIGEAFLQVMGMSAEEAASFAATVDWTTTFVIPVPRYGAEYQEVIVDGVNGTYIQRDREGPPSHYMLLWVRDGVLYALSGAGEVDQALELANSLK